MRSLNFLNKKKPSQRLTKIYIKLGYTKIPFLPSEDECQRIINEYRYFPFSLVPKKNITYLSGNILPGHIIMLWWLDNPRTNKENIPQYFLYEYGIDFQNEKKFLIDKKLVNGTTITPKGQKTLEKYKEVVRKHKAKKTVDKDGNILYSFSDEQAVKVGNKIVPFKSSGDFLKDQDLGRSFERNQDYDNAIKAYFAAKELSLK